MTTEQADPPTHTITHSKEKKREIYKNMDGDRVPSVTTLLNLRAKPQLDAWKAKLWKEGKDPKTESAKEAERGKLMHSYCEAILRGSKLIIPPEVYSDEELDELGNSAIHAISEKFNQFWIEMQAKGYRLKEAEISLVDEENGFGGTIDIMVCNERLYGKDSADVQHVEIWDIKTSKGFFPDQKLQVGGGYSQLAEANGCKVEECRIIRIPKLADSANDKMEMLTVQHEQIGALQQEFMTLLSLYKAAKFSDLMQNQHPHVIEII